MIAHYIAFGFLLVSGGLFAIAGANMWSRCLGLLIVISAYILL